MKPLDLPSALRGSGFESRFGQQLLPSPINALFFSSNVSLSTNMLNSSLFFFFFFSFSFSFFLFFFLSCYCCFVFLSDAHIFECSVAHQRERERERERAPAHTHTHTHTHTQIVLRFASQESLSSLQLPPCFKRGALSGMKLKPSAPGDTVHWAAGNPENPGEIRQLFHQRYGETDCVLNTYVNAWPWPVFRGKRPDISTGNGPTWQGQSTQRKKKKEKRKKEEAKATG